MSSDDASSDESDAAPNGGLGVVREESRHVVDAQLHTMQETDRKAMATARVDALIAGLLLSAASLSESPASVVNVWLLLGSTLVLASLACAVLTYSVDRPSYGVGPGFIDDVTSSNDEAVAVERSVVCRYSEWIEENGDEIASNGTYLLVAQGLLVLGLTGVAVGLYQLIL